MRNDVVDVGHETTKEFRLTLTAWILMAAFLIGALVLNLVPALLSGLVVYEFVHILVPILRLEKLAGKRAKYLSVGLLTTAVITLLSGAIFGLGVYLRSQSGDLSHLLEQIAEIIDESKGALPPFIQNVLPPDADTLRLTIVEWLRTHAEELKTFGINTIRALAYIVLGMIIGGIIALRETVSDGDRTAFVSAMMRRAELLGTSFRMMILAQAKISAINTTFTGIYLLVILPALGIELPLAKTLLVITFVVGLMPVIGNLVSNTAIVVVSFGHSLIVAAGSLLFLVVIHKAEYFLNARIIGTRIQAAAWELLIAMLVMEAIFGIAGVICAPIFYAYIKQELKGRGLI